MMIARSPCGGRTETVLDIVGALYTHRKANVTEALQKTK